MDLDATTPAGEQPAGAVDAPPLGPVRDVGPVARCCGCGYRPTAGDFLRAVGTLGLLAVATDVHAGLAVRWGMPQLAAWVLIAVAMAGAVVATSRILSGRCVGFVPTMIICCTGGITLATLGYVLGTNVAGWLP